MEVTVLQDFFKVWYVLLLLHLFVSVIYYIIIRRFTVKLQAVTETVIVFCIPVFGLIIMAVGKGIYRLVYRGKKPAAHKLSNENMIFTNMRDYDENVIPLNDTFLVDDVKRKRRVFLDAVKQNVLENPKVLRMATHDSDREIAYYAVSMLSSRLESLDSEMSELENKLQQPVNKHNLPMLRLYAQQLSEYVRQEFVDQLTRRDKRSVYLELLNRLMLEDKEISPELKKHYFLEKIDQEMELQMYAEAENTCTLFQKEFSLDEDAYLSFIKLYHAMRNPEKMYAKIIELKACPIRLSVEALRVIRYWGGRQHD